MKSITGTPLAASQILPVPQKSPRKASSGHSRRRIKPTSAKDAGSSGQRGLGPWRDRPRTSHGVTQGIKIERSRNTAYVAALSSLRARRRPPAPHTPKAPGGRGLLREEELRRRYWHVYAGQGGWLKSEAQGEPLQNNGNNAKQLVNNSSIATVTTGSSGIEVNARERVCKVDGETPTDSHTDASSGSTGEQLKACESVSSLALPLATTDTGFCAAINGFKWGRGADRQSPVSATHFTPKPSPISSWDSSQLEDKMDAIEISAESGYPVRGIMDTGVKIMSQGQGGVNPGMGYEGSAITDKSQMYGWTGKRSRMSVFSRMSLEAQCAINETRKEMLDSQSVATDTTRLPGNPEVTENEAAHERASSCCSREAKSDQYSDGRQEDSLSIPDYKCPAKITKTCTKNAHPLTQRGKYFSHKTLTKETPITSNLDLRPNLVRCSNHRTSYKKAPLQAQPTPAALGSKVKATMDSSFNYRDLVNGYHKVPLAQMMKEKTFQITPLGYDCRFKIPIRSEEEDDTPEEVKAKAREKCSEWLKKYT